LYFILYYILYIAVIRSSIINYIVFHKIIQLYIFQILPLLERQNNNNNVNLKEYLQTYINEFNYINMKDDFIMLEKEIDQLFSNHVIGNPYDKQKSDLWKLLAKSSNYEYIQLLNTDNDIISNTNETECTL
jgi:hypothetical protein